ncbi:MAG: sulfotransferase [Pseudomonadota bacterium]
MVKTPRAMIPSDKTFVFVIGTHRSGTSLLHTILRDHDDVSGFKNTGVSEDEGQHLQTVMPNDQELGGVGVASFSPRAHMTEEVADLDRAGALLFQQWAPHWDLSKDILVEKSPPSIARTRFLQAVFPNAHFIVLRRHPIASCLALMKWVGSREPIYRLIENWVRLYETLEADLPYLKRVHTLYYEDLVSDPKTQLDQISAFLNLKTPLDPSGVKSGLSNRYFETWMSGEYYMWRGQNPAYRYLKRNYNHLKRMQTVLKLERRLNRLGYSFKSQLPL